MKNYWPQYFQNPCPTGVSDNGGQIWHHNYLGTSASGSNTGTLLLWAALAFLPKGLEPHPHPVMQLSPPTPPQAAPGEAGTVLA